MSIFALFEENITSLPDLKRRGYFAGDFFFNFYGKSNPIRFGCVYSNKSLGEEREESERYLLIVEVFEEKPNIEFLEKEGNFIYGYVPSFPLTQNYINAGNTFLSIAEGNKIFSIINLKQEMNNLNELPGIPSFFDAKYDNKLKNFATLFISENLKRIGFLPIFNFSKYLPSSAKKWRLVTFFLGYSALKVDNTIHLISNLQGNYQKNFQYLNLILQFIYKFSEGKVNLRPEGEEIAFNGKKIFRKEIGSILNLSFYNEKENYVARVSNNSTTSDPKIYEDEMKALLMKAVKKLENYSCEQETAEFIKFVEKFKGEIL